VQSPVKTVPTVTKRIKKPGNNDLPDGVDSKLWRPVFVSTYLQYIGSTTNPWEVPVKTACKIMQLIWDAIFPDIPHTITSTSPVYIIVSPLNMSLIVILMFVCRLTNEPQTPGAV
jgi:hypothetical protein